MLSHRERAAQGFDLLVEGLVPFVEGELRRVYRDRWRSAAGESFRHADRVEGDGEGPAWDAHKLLAVMWDQWSRVFYQSLKRHHRSLVSELTEFRNRWAHQQAFDFDDAYRLLDSIERLLEGVNAGQRRVVHDSKRELIRMEFGRDLQTRQQGESRGKRLQSVAVQVACCAAIVATLLLKFGTSSWILGAAICGLFGYLVAKTLSHRAQLIGPDECQHCGRIIYRYPCPYCSASGKMDAA